MNKDKTIEKGAGFTQGPWISDWVGTKPSGSAVVWLGENTNKRIEVFGTGKDLANARLIAQAPELYAQAKILERVLLLSIGNSHEMYKKLRELLAKVDGGEG